MHPPLARPHLATLLDDFRRYGSDRAVVSHTGNRSLPSTYAELAELSARFAAEFARRGIASGERILLWGQNSAAWIAAFYGCVLRGILVVPLDAAGDPRFAQRVIAETLPQLLVGDTTLLQKLQPSDVPVLALDAANLPAPDYRPAPGLNRSTPLQIIFTSGTTSEPKGIVHTHGNVLASLDPIEREIGKYRRYERPFHPLRFLHTLPLSHVFGQFMGLWVPPLLAAEVHFESRLDAPRLIQLIHSQRISVLAAVPRILELLRGHLTRLDPTLAARLESSEKVSALGRWWRFRRQHRLFGWKFWAFVCGGATLPEDLEQFWTRLGFALIQGYGMTETTALVTLNHPFHTARGSIGKPLAGREVKVAEDGEILVRGDSIAETEWRAGQAQARIADEGWLRTGDLAARNAEGELVFAGRKSDVIVTAAGLNVHPQDLEAALAHQPGVRDACAFSFDNGAGPQPAAALLMNDQSKADAAVASANAALADYQQIRRWLLWPEPDFPRTSTGKVKRRDVAARATLAFRSSGEVSGGDDSLIQALRTIPGARVENVSDASRLSEDIGLDSLGMVELQSALEQQFAVEIPEDAWQRARTVGDLRAFIAHGGRTAEGVVGGAAAMPPTPTAVSAPAVYDDTIYPRWPWSAPIRWLRIAFLECVSIPLTHLLLGPRVERPRIPRAAQADAHRGQPRHRLRSPAGTCSIACGHPAQNGGRHGGRPAHGLASRAGRAARVVPAAHAVRILARHCALQRLSAAAGRRIPAQFRARRSCAGRGNVCDSVSRRTPICRCNACAVSVRDRSAGSRISRTGAARRADRTGRDQAAQTTLVPAGHCDDSRRRSDDDEVR